MKYSAFILIFFAFHFEGICQRGNSGNGSILPTGPGAPIFKTGAGTPYFLIDPEWKVTAMQAGVVWGIYGDIKGSAFYTDEWRKGYILLQDKRIAKDISLSFNAYENQIFYLRDSEALVLNAAVPVAEFGMYDNKEDSNKITIFRCGYPSIGRNDEKTFYQVLSGNRITLLKHYSKSIVQRNNYMSAPDKIFSDSEAWYIYKTAENKMVAIKKNKSALEEALPQYAGIIQSIIQQKNLKLKTENEWVSLFEELNKEAK